MNKTQTKTKKIVILGDSAFAEVAYECFTHDSEYEVVGFAVEGAYLKQDRLFDLPVVAFETLEQVFDPAQVHFYAALVYTQLNRLRTRLYRAAKSKGYIPASYVSSRAFVWGNVQLGEHCFVFEDNTLQPFARIGDNVVLWSGNHIGHHSRIGDNCFVSSHVVVSGFCEVGENSFLGVNCSLGNNVAVGRDNWLGPGVVLTSGTEPNQLFRLEQPEAARVSATRFFRVKE
ncbi:MAG TPA: acetyltransferase [Ramlibacter sp.]|jgi:sugar O-acyltransferase (sialic acid O-acetyltransferase NeuD family)|uniref:acetyltransferase n=1 Tax=Ramlibacter sp. TaxID=1917967 RepID=UPI002D5568E6|nr:acetyltransferase [Ramlibacter sp.]HZY20071.1 acetyltransferase [Ramlibacter sp.]